MDFLSEQGSNTSDGGLKDNFSSQFTLKITDPLICKILRHPTFKNDAGENIFAVPVRYWPYRLGPNDSDIRFRPCRESLNLGQSVEYEYYKGLYKQLDELKAAGKKDSNEFKALEALIKKVKPKYFYYYLYVVPGNSTVKALKASMSIHNQIAGRTENQFVSGIPSVFTAAIKKGMNISLTPDPEKNSTGWMKIYKTGEKMATRYFVEIDTKKEYKNFDGQSAEVTIVNKHPAPDLEAIKNGAWPDIFKFEKEHVWSEEECQAAVDSGFSKIPNRILEAEKERLKKKQDKESSVVTDNIADANLDEIPF